MTVQKEHERNQWPLLTDMLEVAYRDVDPQLWQWWDTYLRNVFSGFLEAGINPEMVKIVMTSSAVKQIASPNPRYNGVRNAMRSLHVEEKSLSRASRRRQMILQDTKPDIDFAIVQFDKDALPAHQLDRVLQKAYTEGPQAPALDVFPIPTNPRVSIYNFATKDPSGLHLQAFNYIIWGEESSDGIDKRRGSTVPWGSQPSLDLIPTLGGIRILPSSIKDSQEALDRPLHYSLPDNPQVFDELEVVLRTIRGKALHDPEMNPFVETSAYDLSHLFSMGELFLQIPVHPEHCDEYDQAVALMIREIAVTALAHGDAFYQHMVQKQPYGYRLGRFIEGLAQSQNSVITDEGRADPEIFVKQLMGIPLTSSSPNQMINHIR